MDQVDAEQQVQRARRDATPALPAPGRVQVQGRLHVGQPLRPHGGRDAAGGRQCVGASPHPCSCASPAPPARTHLSRQRWSTSDGCHSAKGKARAKWAACWPEPEATSSTRAPRCSGSKYWRSTRRIGSLFRSAATATIIWDIISLRARPPRRARRELWSGRAGPVGNYRPVARSPPGVVV